MLASRSDEVNSTTPHHQTPHTPDTLRMGRDWPVMPTIRELVAIRALPDPAIDQAAPSDHIDDTLL